ncbi:KUP/HAK/KT family potassium transporter [Schlesneria sp. T3-172]|uniref:KUP/HAK/KT family potassium transporter n=1 Tax=Schlesneria sphaerica TaxID=3373610 RepID=UPI0037C5EFDC
MSHTETSSTDGAADESDHTAEPTPLPTESPRPRSLWVRIREATGTVYGDIGTSVLYTTMEITRETVRLKNHHLPHNELNALLLGGGADLLNRNEVLGGLSLVFWALMFVTIKYDLLVMRADDRGEGGTFALWSLLQGYTGRVVGITVLSYLVVAAAGLLASDGIITPSISMLGAFEPLGETPAIIATLCCLFVMFKVQWRGTSKIGGFFGWFMLLVWFPWIALKGLPWIIRRPDIFEAVNPWFALQFLMSFPSAGAFVLLGVVVLAITGGEAKFVDIGHFAVTNHEPSSVSESLPPALSGRYPVMISWLVFVLPCLLLNYAGQAAYILQEGVPPRGNCFYALTPKFGDDTTNYVMLVIDLFLSAIAAFIASQALITGLFSITKQAIELGFMPRCDVRYTSHEAEGQVYLPAVNWLMFAGCVAVTLSFRSAGNLAAAYGIAVTATMVITTLFFGYVTFYRWRWPIWLSILVCLPILLVDLTFFTSNLLKIIHGGYFPVLIAIALTTIMLTWQWGRSQLSSAFYRFGVREGKKLDWLIALRDMLDDLELTMQENLPYARKLVQGRRKIVESDRAAVFLCSRPIRGIDDYVPIVLRVFLKKYGVLPSYIVFLHVRQISQPYAKVTPSRYEVFHLGHDIDSVVATFGYLEQPSVRETLRELQSAKQIRIAADRWIIEVGEEDVIAGQDLGLLQQLRLWLFRWILRISTPAHKYLGLVYDAAISKEIIPVVFNRDDAKVALPELEIEATGEGSPA